MRRSHRWPAALLLAAFPVCLAAEPAEIRIVGARHEQEVAPQPSPHRFVGPPAMSARRTNAFVVNQNRTAVEVEKAVFGNQPENVTPLFSDSFSLESRGLIHADRLAGLETGREFKKPRDPARMTGVRGSFASSYGVTGGVRNGIEYSVTGGARNGITSNVTGGARNGISYGVTGGARNGIEYRVTGGARNDIRYADQ